MGRGFGRGARVTVTTRAQAKQAGKKTPRGLRNSKKKMKREKRAKQELDDAAMGDASTRDQQKPTAEGTAKAGKLRGVEGDTSLVGGKRGTLAHQIASVSIPTLVMGKGQKLKHLRKQLMASVKGIRQRFNQKAKGKAAHKAEVMAQRYKEERRRREKAKRS